MQKKPLQFRAIIRRVGEHLKPIPKTSDLQDYLDARFKEGQEVNLVVKRYFRRRTTGKNKGTADEESNQNGYYWKVVIPYLGEYFGYLPWEMHEALKYKFFSKPSEKDPELRKVGTSTEYNTVEWEDKMEEIRTWALTDHSIKIPLPNEVDLEEAEDAIYSQY